MLRVGGRDTALLGIDREVEHAASVAAAALGIGPEVVAFVEPEGYLVTRFVEGEDGRGRPGRGRAAVAPAAHRRADPRPVRPVPRRRGLRRHRTARPECHCPPPTSRRERSPAGSSAGCAPAAPAPCHNDLLAAQLRPRRAAALDRRLGIRRHGRPGLRSGELRRQQRPRRRRRPRAARGLRRRRPGAAHAPAVHVGLPRGDVGGRAAGGVRARLRLRGLRGRALRRASSRRPRSRASAAPWPDRHGAAGPGADRQARRSARARRAYISIASYTSTEPPLAKIGQSFASATAASRLSAAMLE